MNQRSRIQILVASAIMLNSIALLWTVLTLFREPAFRREQAQQKKLIAQLQALEAKASALERIEHPFYISTNALNPRILAEQIFKTADVNIVTESPSDQFRLHSLSIRYQEIEYDLLPDLIRDAEQRRPPLKMTSCILETTPKASGKGRAQLTFQQVEWL